MNGPSKVFASRALIGRNLKTCQTEITRARNLFSETVCFSRDGKFKVLGLGGIFLPNVLSKVSNVQPEALN